MEVVGGEQRGNGEGAVTQAFYLRWREALSARRWPLHRGFYLMLGGLHIGAVMGVHVDPDPIGKDTQLLAGAGGEVAYRG